MPRLFTGLEIPREVAERLAAMRGGLPGARWIDVENYHVTLRFIGDIDERLAGEIVETLDRVKRRRIAITIDGLMVFGTRRPHSVVARVRPTQALSELQGEHERLMQRLGLPPEPRKFQPHVTIARCKACSAEQVAHWLSIRGGLSLPTFEVEEFVLFSSRDSVGGGPYIVEESYSLVA
ncbi:MAG: RNA 2',3'-cyclic phosphodiesterase [Hyphomicrobiaceae bacterium]|nr:RNA 2',3'-cyclic phosphodiesterase [Hyphomicrobiaceae bacterium]